MTVVTLKRLKSQKEFVRSDKPYICIAGGLGSGKTSAGIYRIIKNLFKYNGASYAYYMPSYDLIKLRGMSGFLDIFSEHGIPHKVNKSDYTIELPNGSRVIFRSMQNPERIVSYEVSGSILDELDTLPKDKAEYVWRKVAERNRETGFEATNWMGVVSTPDHGIHGFMYDFWVKRDTVDKHLIKARTEENTFLPPEYIEQIRQNYDPILAELYLEGHFVNLNRDRVYYQFDKDKHVKKVEVAQLDPIHVGQDFNIGGCISTLSVLQGGTLCTFDVQSFKNTYQVVDYLKLKYPNRIVTIYPDASGGAGSTNATKSDLDIIRQAGLRIMAGKANPRVRDRVNSVNHALYHNKLSIDPSCSILIQALESQSYNDKGEPEKSTDAGSVDDVADSYGYKVHKLMPIVKPVIGNYSGVS